MKEDLKDGSFRTYAEDGNPNNVLARDAEGKKLLGGPARRLKDDITTRSYGSRV
jgi:hypothetical protein